MFDNCKVGQVTLGNFMRKMSAAAGLSRTYTNYCIRATSITLVYDNFLFSHNYGCTYTQKTLQCDELACKKKQSPKTRHVLTFNPSPQRK